MSETEPSVLFSGPVKIVGIIENSHLTPSGITEGPGSTTVTNQVNFSVLT